MVYYGKETKMNAYEKIEKLEDGHFKLITGVTRKVFQEMAEG